MKIAVYHNLPSGGAKRTLHETLSRLAPRHALHVFTLTTADERFCDLRLVAQNWRAYRYVPSPMFDSPLGRLNQLQRWRDLWRLDALQRQVATEIDQGGFDVVFVEPCMWTQAPLLLRHLRTPAGYYCHELPRTLYERPRRQASTARTLADRVDPLIGLYRTTARWLDRQATRAAQTVLVNSKFMRDRVGPVYGVAPVVSYHGVDAVAFQPRPDVTRHRYVLSVGAIQPHKGYDFLIESLATLPAKARPHLHLVGNAPLPDERQRLIELAHSRAVPLEIETDVTDAILLRRYNEAAVLAYAPYDEPFGLVPLEAMACATPVVAVADGGVPETVVHEWTGLLVQRDRHQFASAVQRLLADGGACEAYGRRAREHVVAHWTWDAAVDRVEAHLLCAAQGARPSGYVARPSSSPSGAAGSAVVRGPASP